MDFNKLYINGQWQDGDSGRTIAVENPWTLDTLAEVPRGNGTDVDRAVAAAKAAFPAWSAKTPQERADIIAAGLEKFKAYRDTLIDLEIDELGQPRAWTTKMHVDRNFNRIESFLTIARTYRTEEKLDHGIVVREPIGVVALLTPWNYPLGQVVQKVTPALLAGNTAVLKPSQTTPLSAYYMVQAFADAGLPAGVLNLVTGAGGEVGDALTSHPDVRLVSFTGSTASGRQVGRDSLSTIKKIALELGGKSPLVVLPGADYADAAKIVAGSCFANSGQTCTAYTRLVVPEADKDKALAALKEEAKNWRAGDPRDPESTLGPIVNAKQYAKVCDHIAIALADGGQMVIGQVPDKKAEKRLVQPIVFTDLPAQAKAVREEIFGPVLVVQTYRDVEEAVKIANDTPYGLAAGVVGPEEAAVAVARRLDAGQVTVNFGARDIFAPFGGYKESGLGREGGVMGYEEYLEVKALFY